MEITKIGSLPFLFPSFCFLYPSCSPHSPAYSSASPASGSGAVYTPPSVPASDLVSPDHGTWASLFADSPFPLSSLMTHPPPDRVGSSEEAGMRSCCVFSCFVCQSWNCSVHSRFDTGRFCFVVGNGQAVQVALVGTRPCQTRRCRQRALTAAITSRCFTV